MMGIALLFTALLAQAVPPPPPVRDAQAERVIGQLSAEGRAAIQAEMAADRARRESFDARLTAARRVIADAARAQPLDIARLRAALDARDAIEVERLRERTIAAMALLERLPAADRGIVALVIPEASGASGPPPPGPVPLPPPQRRR